MPDQNNPDGGETNALPDMAAILRAAAYESWRQRREAWQDDTEALFNRAYLGHYSHIDHYVETMVDDYGLDAKLDAAVIEPFRPFVDIDIPGLARSLVRLGSLYAISAAPVGVWVFNGDIE